MFNLRGETLYNRAYELGYVNTPKPQFFTEEQGRGWTGNPALCNAVAYTLDPDERIREMGIAWVNLTFIQVDAHEYKILRFPNTPEEYASWDELTGHSIFAPALVHSVMSKQDWNVVEGKGLRWWMGRNIGFVLFVKMRAGVRLGPVSQTLWSLAMLVGSLQKSVSGDHLNWLMAQWVAKKDYQYAKLGLYLWSRIMARKYPLGPSQLLEVYYGKNHVFVEFAKERKWY